MILIYNLTYPCTLVTLPALVMVFIRDTAVVTGTAFAAAAVVARRATINFIVFIIILS